MLTRFSLTATPGGSTLTLDDVTFEGVSATVQVDGDGIPTVTVSSPGTGTIEGQGIVKVVEEPTEADVFGALAVWLDTVDPGVLIPLVESRLVSLSQHPVAETLKVLAELAQEACRG